MMPAKVFAIALLWIPLLTASQEVCTVADGGRPAGLLQVNMDRPRVGSQVVKGCASSDTRRVLVRVLNEVRELIDSKEATPDAKNGVFEVKLDQPLRKRETVSAAAERRDPKSLDRAAREHDRLSEKASDLAKEALNRLKESAAETEPGRKRALEDDSAALKKASENLMLAAKNAGAAPETPEEKLTIEPFELGRVHAHFELGAILSKAREDFSKYDIYLGFQVANDWFRNKPDGGSSENNPIEGFNLRVGTEFDARLTASPVPAENPQINPKKLLESKKSAVIQGTLYVPMYAGITSWLYPDADHSDEKRWNALFLGPVVKGGAQTIAGSANDPKLANDKVFPFYAYGARFGHLKFAPSRHEAPELTSYLDVTCEVRNTLFKFDDVTKRKFYPNRLGIEGRFKIPKLPIQIGIDSSFGGSLGGDVRFLFGMQKFDVTTLARKLKTLGSI